MFEVSMKDKVCIITGASQGIGKATALVLAKADVKALTIVDLVKGELGDAVEKELTDMGVEVNFIEGDASSEEIVKQAVDSTVEKWGKIDAILNIAGVSKMTDLVTTSAEQWDRTLGINLRSIFLFTKYGSEVMKEQGYGSIVNMSSIAGITGGSTGPDYGASKAGVVALTKFCAKQLGKYNIRVNAVAPGTIATDMIIKRNYANLSPEEYQKKMDAIPMKRMGDPEEVGKVFLFLASDMGSYVSGDTIMVTGARMS